MRTFPRLLIAVSLLACTHLTHWMTPATAADAQEVQKVFDELYGAQLARVETTIGKDDDLEMAKTMLGVATTVDDEPQLAIMICLQAHKMTHQVPEGFPLAEEAIDFLIKKAPEQKEKWVALLIDLRQRQFKATRGKEHTDAGQAFIKTLESAADQYKGDKKNTEAGTLYRRAIQVAAQIRSKEDSTRLRAKVEQMAIERRAEGKIHVLLKRLEVNLKDEAAAQELVRLLIVEMDQPEKVKEYAFVLPGQLKRNAQLAAEDPGQLAAEDAWQLAMWYQRFSDSAPKLHRQRLLLRTQALYERFLEVHTKKDVRQVAAKSRLQKVSQTLVKMDSAKDPKNRATRRTSRTIIYSGRPIAVEAEQAAAVVSPFRFSRDGGASGGSFGYLPVPKGVDPASMREVSKGRIAFYVNARQAGTVQFFGRVRALPGSISSFYVGVIAGQKLDPEMKAWNFSSKPNQWTWVRYGTISLKAGINTIVIAGREAGTGIDAIRIQPTRDGR
jgi:hypothetical protein